MTYDAATKQFDPDCKICTERKRHEKLVADARKNYDEDIAKAKTNKEILVLTADMKKIDQIISKTNRPNN